MPRNVRTSRLENFTESKKNYAGCFSLGNNSASEGSRRNVSLGGHASPDPYRTILHSLTRGIPLFTRTTSLCNAHKKLVSSRLPFGAGLTRITKTGGFLYNSHSSACVVKIMLSLFCGFLRCRVLDSRFISEFHRRSVDALRRRELCIVSSLSPHASSALAIHYSSGLRLSYFPAYCGDEYRSGERIGHWVSDAVT